MCALEARRSTQHVVCSESSGWVTSDDTATESDHLGDRRLPSDEAAYLNGA